MKIDKLIRKSISLLLVIACTISFAGCSSADGTESFPALDSIADFVVSAAEKAVQKCADGYEYYHKYNAPYTDYQKRINELKQMVSKGLGEWTGTAGESEFILGEPIIEDNGLKITTVSYRNGIPDFSPYAIAEVKIPNMTNDRDGEGGNYEQADTALARHWSEINYNDKSNWTSSDVRDYRENYPIRLTWHEMSNMHYMQLVPYDVNRTFKHFGGVAEYNAMMAQKEKVEQAYD